MNGENIGVCILCKPMITTKQFWQNERANIYHTNNSFLIMLITVLDNTWVLLCL